MKKAIVEQKYELTINTSFIKKHLNEKELSLTYLSFLAGYKHSRSFRSVLKGTARRNMDIFAVLNRLATVLDVRPIDLLCNKKVEKDKL